MSFHFVSFHFISFHFLFIFFSFHFTSFIRSLVHSVNVWLAELPVKLSAWIVAVLLTHCLRSIEALGSGSKRRAQWQLSCATDFRWLFRTIIHSNIPSPSIPSIPSIHSIHSFIISFILSFFHSFILSFFQSFNHSVIQSFSQFSSVQLISIQFNSVLFSSVQFNPIQFSSIQFNLSLFFYFVPLLSSPPTIPISNLFPIVSSYFWNFRPAACRGLPGMHR
jgi:hypothetical protein